MRWAACCAVFLWCEVVACTAFAQPSSRADEPNAEPRRLPAESWSVPALHGLGLMAGMRIGAAFLWPDPFADTDLGRIGERYEKAYTLPPKWDGSRAAFEWDGDPWYVNVVGHTLFGSELYMRARICQKYVYEALLFAAAGSTLWEYGFEASGVRPSGLDLWFTPASGLIFGEVRYVAWRAAAAIRTTGWRRVLVSVIDPFGELERGFGSAC